MESNARNKTRLTGRRFQHHKTISEGSINDSGYHSGVFTSPEFTRSLGNIHNASGPNIENLTFDGPIKRARLTSTPLNISTKKNFDFSFPSPKLSDDRASAISVCESSSDCVFLSNIEKSELVIISEIPPSSSLDVPKTKPKTSGSKLVSLRPAISSRKPKSVLIRLLKEADYLLYEVLKHLSACDLIIVSHVNKQLRYIILGNKELNGKRLTYIGRRRIERERVGKENFKVKRLNEGGGVTPGTSYRKQSPPKHLGEVQNLQLNCKEKASVNIGAPILSLADRFVEEGKKLPHGEELRKCVKCQAPAQVQKNILRAICSSESCRYDYCMRCYLPSHRKAQDCSVLKPRTRKSGGIFSKKCKKNLRRL